MKKILMLLAFAGVASVASAQQTMVNFQNWRID